MELKVLVDNNLGEGDVLISEHGLSIWMEVDGRQWLIDTGASDAFARNAIQLGIDIANVDYLILSHGHSDHCGGLETFLSLNGKAQIFISANIENNLFFSTRRGSKRNISLNHSLIQNNLHRFVFIDKNLRLSENANIITKITHTSPQPQANSTLLKNDLPDDFNHEIALAITTSKGVIIISPCSHNGVINTIESCSHLGDITHYIGGTHLVDNFESDGQLLNLALNLRNCYPNLTLISGHCTGECAKRAFQKELNDKFIVFYTGFSLFID